MRTRVCVPWVVAVAMVALTQAPPSAQNRRSEAPDIPRLPFERYTLPNGLTVLLSQNRQLPMVAVNVWYHVGPANEEPGRTGFAHLFEHMMFQGSKHTPPDSHFRLLEAAGASGVNGTTDYDRTNYFETVPSNQVELALWLESDRMGYLLEQIDEAALANQQDVVRNERRQSVENQPYGLAGEALVQTLFPSGHPYYGDVIGSHADIQAARLGDVRRFFRQYYAPNNASLAIVGDFDPAAMKQLVQKYFGTLRRGPAVPPIRAVTPGITSERRRVVNARVQLPRVYMAWMTSPAFKPGDAEARLTADILGGGRSSRLYKKLVYELQIAQNVVAYQQSLRLGSIFQILATARPGHTAEELEKAIDAELVALRARAPDPAEVVRARHTIETNLITGVERLGGLANRANLYNYYLGTPDYLEKDVLALRAITPDGVMTFARQQLGQNARVVLHAVPGQPDPLPQVPTPPTPSPAAGGTESINADEPWRGTPPAPSAARPLVLPPPASVELSNGLTLILSQRPGLPIVAANLVLKAGSEANPIETPGLASFAAAMLDEGTTTRSSLQIADEVAQLGGALGPDTAMDATTVSVRSLAKNFPAMLDLLADVVLRPSFPADEIERQRASRLAQVLQQRDSPPQIAAQTMSMALYGARHPYGYAEIGTEGSIKTTSRGDLVAFWKEHFMPNEAALVVAGDISMAELRALAEKALGAWPRGTPQRRAPGAPATTAARLVIVDKPGSPQTQVRVATIGVPRSTRDFRPLQVMNLILGGSFSSRINMNLREQHGYTYGANSQFVFRRHAGPFAVAAGVRTDVTAPAVSEIFKEIRAMLESPPTPDEIGRAKASLTDSLASAFETRTSAVNNLSNVFIYDLGLDYYTRFAAEVQAVTAEQALAVARRYLVPERLVVIAVGDRAAIEAELVKLGLGAVEIRDPDGRPVS